MKRHCYWLAAITGLLLAMGGMVDAAEELTGSTWRVEAVKGAGAIDTANTEFLIQPDGRFNTTVGCNRMSGKAAIAGSKLTFGLIASTKMFCEDLMDLEQKYEAALAATQSFRTEGGLLKFADSSGRDLITFARAL